MVHDSELYPGLYREFCVKECLFVDAQKIDSSPDKVHSGSNVKRESDGRLCCRMSVT